MEDVGCEGKLSNSVTPTPFLREKVGKLTVGEIIFIIFGVLVLICFLISVVLSVVENLEKDSHATAAVHILNVLGCIFLLAFGICGCYLWHSKGGIRLCQKICLSLGMLLFCGFLSFLLAFWFARLNGNILWSFYREPSKKEYNNRRVAMASNAYNTFIFICFIIYIGFMVSVHRQCQFKRPFSTCQVAYIVLAVSVLICLLLIITILLLFAFGSSYLSNPDLTTVETFLEKLFFSCPPICFVLLIPLLSLSCYMGFFGDHFTKAEIAFGTLGILIILCFVILVIFEMIDTGKDMTQEGSTFLHVLQFVLLVPFLFLAYRLGLFGGIIKQFKGESKAIKKNLTTEPATD